MKSFLSSTYYFYYERIINNSDNQNKKAYPLQTFQNKIRRKKCRVCDIYPAKYVTLGDNLAPENPCFYCEQCFSHLHVNQHDGLHDFETFPYYHE